MKRNSAAHRSAWAGLCRMGLVSMALTASALPAVAQDQAAGGAAPLSASSQQTRITVPAGALEGALLSFGRQAGLRLFYDTALTTGRTTQGVRGSMTVTQALGQLLAGTGLTWRFTGQNGVTLLPVSATGSATGTVVLPEVNVQAGLLARQGDGYVAGISTTGTKTDTPLLETPQSISVVTREQMDAQGSTTAEEALRYTAGVRIGSYGADSRVDEIQVRGFRTGSFANNLYLDGLRPPGSSSGASASATQFEAFGLERVEVLRGPASILYGQVAPGGLVNAVSKRPTDYPRGEVSLSTSTDNLLRGNFDISGPLDEDGHFSYRLVTSAYHTDTQVDHVSLNRIYVAPSITWRPDTDTSLTLLGAYQNDTGGSTYQFLPSSGTYFPTQYGRIGSNTFLGEPDYSHYNRTQIALGYALEHRLSEMLTVRQNLRYMHVETYNAGVSRSGDTLADGRTINRSASNNAIISDGFAVDTNAQLRLSTGPLNHTLLAGLDYRMQDIKVQQASGTVGSLDIFNPVYGTPVSIGRRAPSTSSSANQFGIYLQDQVRLGGWVLTVGGRQDWSENESLNLRTNADSRYTANAGTWRAGLLYLFENGFAPYVSYATSFEPASGTDYFGNAFEPTTGQQYEAGIKYQPPGGRSMFTLAAYQLTQQNISTPDPDPTHVCNGSRCTVQTGEGRVRGIEAEAQLALTDSLNLIASYTYMDSEVTRSNSTDLGNRLSMVPRHIVGGWADYRFREGMLAGLFLGGGVRYTGSTYGDSANDYPMRSYTLFDASIRYDLERLSPDLHGMALAVNGINLADKEYLAACSGSASCYYGPRRTVTASLRYRW